MSANKKILIITYYWPPSGGAAVQRWLSLSNELQKKGWQVFVITVDEKYATYQLYDPGLVNDIHPGIIVTKTKTREPFGLYKSLFGKKSIPAPGFSNESNPSFLKKTARFIRGNFFIPDPRKGWKSYLVKAASDIITKENIRHVITAGPPHSTHLSGMALKKAIPSINWICDFHDLWTDVIYYKQLYHIGFVKKKDLALEKLVLESADHVLTVGEKYREKLLSKSKVINPQKVHIIRIGYDEELFKPVAKTEQEKFTITYTGTIAQYYHPETFFTALQKVVKRYPALPVTLKIVGIMAESIKAQIAALGLSSILDDKGYISHKEAVEELFKASCLLLVNPVTADEEMVIPGKIYEYLAAYKPIINITSHKSETAALINESNAGATFERTEADKIERYLEAIIEKWLKEKNTDLPFNKSVEQYSRTAIAEQLIAVLDNA